MDKGGWLTVGMGNTIALIKALSGGGGSGGGVQFIGATYDDSGDNPTITLDKTWKEIYDLIAAGTLCALRFALEKIITIFYVLQVEAESSTYNVYFFDPSNIDTLRMEFYTNSEDGYPVYTIIS